MRPKALDADIFSERSPGILARLIRWFTKSEVNHVGLVFIMSGERRNLLRDYGQRIPAAWLGRACVVEASWRVTVHLLSKRLAEKSSMRLYRLQGLEDDERQCIVRAALGFVGQRYGVGRLFAFAVDILFRTKSVRRMGLDVMVCSYLAAYPYSLIGCRFNGRRPRACTPEDIVRAAEAGGRFAEYWREHPRMMGR